MVAGIITLIIFLITNLISFRVGRRLGAKEGIDYCFDKYEEEVKKRTNS